jgi:hypothetical protein
MIIIGADYHPSFQQIAFVDTETGDSIVMTTTSGPRNLVSSGTSD